MVRVKLKPDAKVVSPYGSYLATDVWFDATPHPEVRGAYRLRWTDWLVGVALPDQIESIRLQ